jgi:hypothetical protein
MFLYDAPSKVTLNKAQHNFVPSTFVQKSLWMVKRVHSEAIELNLSEHIFSGQEMLALKPIAYRLIIYVCLLCSS